MFHVSPPSPGHLACLLEAAQALEMESRVQRCPDNSRQKKLNQDFQNYTENLSLSQVVPILPSSTGRDSWGKHHGGRGGTCPGVVLPPAKLARGPSVWAPAYSHKVLFSSVTATIAFAWAFVLWISLD